MIRIFRTTYILLLTVTLALLYTGCVDDTFADYNTDYGDGIGNLQVQVEFKNLSPALDTRTAGNAIGPVDTLQMVIYSYSNGTATFCRRVVCNELKDYTLNATEPSDAESGNNLGPTGEETIHNATFKIEDLPYGAYKIYAVANVPGLTDEQCRTEESLKNIQLTWNSDNVAKNNAMFGYFTSADNQRSSGFDAPLIAVNQPSVSIHSWIKRLASKVTVAFDPSELKEAVTVYIKSVTIHDIPHTCLLGMDNKPGEKDSLLQGETIDYSNGSSDYNKWAIKMQKGSGRKGSSEHRNDDEALFFFENKQGDFSNDPNKKDYLKEQIPDETGTSINEPGDNLYGGENGPKDNDFKDRVKYGSYIEVVGYYVSKNSEKMSAGNIKYRFMLGKDITYNYDAERNFHYKLTLKLRGFANEADWHIVYEEPTPSLYTPDKFYVSYLYGQESAFPVRVVTGDTVNTERYTLVAKIIENPWWPYDEDLDDAPPVTIGSGTNMKGFAWMKSAVYNIASGTGVLSSPEYYIKGDKGDGEFKDENDFKNYAGFLSLRKPETVEGRPNVYKDIEFPDVTDDKNYGPNHNKALREYYIKNNVAYAAYSLKVGKRNVGLYEGNKLNEGKETDGQYTVTKDADGSVTLKVPMYTRPLKMVAASDFSGNNPYPSFMRRAFVRFTLYDHNGKKVNFKDLANNDEEVDHRDVPILQVRRVENPKAIYRAWNNNASFKVHLMHRRHDVLNEEAASKFQGFESIGPWRASILACTEDFVQLTGNGQTVTQKGQYIYGSSGTEIEFTYEPTGNCGQYATRCAIILVEYHDYTCNHMIFVRQGYDKGVDFAGTDWSLYQVYAAKGTQSDQPQDGADKTVTVDVTKNPLSMGSLLKRGNYNASIREADNPGWLEDISDLSVAYYNGNKVDTTFMAWGSIGGFGWYRYDGKEERYTKKWADTWNATINGSTKKMAVPTCKDYENLRDNYDFGFGIAYADDAIETATDLDVAYGYIDAENKGVRSSNGMRVCVAYSINDGRNIIFPISKEGHGRRPLGGAYAFSDIPNSSYGYKTSRKAGVLSYGGLASVLWADVNKYRPITYNHYRTPGAVYWVNQPHFVSGDANASYASWDINYFTLTFNKYSEASLGNFKGDGVTNATTCSDALPIKLIYKKEKKDD